MSCRRDFLFQFHYGTIKSGEINPEEEKEIAHFNSTMVRLKERVRRLHNGGFHISIPLWYD